MRRNEDPQRYYSWYPKNPTYIPNGKDRIAKVEGWGAHQEEGGREGVGEGVGRTEAGRGEGCFSAGRGPEEGEGDPLEGEGVALNGGATTTLAHEV